MLGPPTHCRQSAALFMITVVASIAIRFYNGFCFFPPALPRNKYHTNSRHAKLPSSKFIAANIFRGTGFTFVALSGKSAMWSSNARTAFHAAQHAARRYRLALRAGKHFRVGSPSLSSMAIAGAGGKNSSPFNPYKI